MSRHHRHRHDDRSARRHILRAQLEDVQAQRPLLRRLYARWLPSRVSAAFEAVFAYIWKATLGRLVVAKLHLNRDAARAEAAALRLVRASTRVPVPRVYAVLPWFGDHYLLMSRMRGTELADVWTQLPDVAKDAVADQLRGFLIELRALRSPFGSAICSPTGERLHDPRLPAKHRGPFADEDAFNYVLRYFEPLHNLPPAVQDSHARVHDIVFTHGDIMPRNVLVDAAAPARVVALLDWDSAGWFPTHWEYRKARWTAAGELEETWVPRLGRIVEPFPDEADADDYLSRRFWAPS